jgi:hypothetical protein
MLGFRGGPSCAPAKLAEYNNMELQVISLLGATMSLECAILLLGAVLFLDYRRALRRRWLLGHLESILQGDRESELMDMPDAA